MVEDFLGNRLTRTFHATLAQDRYTAIAVSKQEQQCHVRNIL